MQQGAQEDNIYDEIYELEERNSRNAGAANARASARNSILSYYAGAPGL